ncbi:F1-ATP synthase assembly protein [Boeremia exigua]|uniref:F1-ATP synthase assembly protein n=1 Tax=Boeremia exigua TaxID=749465 RepID=UPI001E8D4012|nr:F1-ATP synthase assembly protein [Boeremia exigua]KAH6644717.1 F1-ATP synthase assembly protein [Boeremia exigua]
MQSLRPALAAVRLSAPRRAGALYQCLHTSATRCATPLPHPSVPGPPPESPTSAASDARERVARKQRQAEMIQQARSNRASAAKPASALKKRFWTDVTVKETNGGFQVFLDQRPVRGPDKETLTVPLSKHQLATAIALEWDMLVSAQQALKTHYIPMTSLAARANDIAQADIKGDGRIRDSILQLCDRYLSTDTLLCWAPAKVMNDVKQNGKTLRELQEEVATGIITYLTTHVWPGVQIKPILDADSIMPIEQPDNTKDVIRSWISALPAYELAGLERAVLASKSVLIASRLLHEWAEGLTSSPQPNAKKTFGIEEAASAASLEVRWQIQAWGEVEDTHDVEREDMKRQLGSVILLVGGDSA